MKIAYILVAFASVITSGLAASIDVLKKDIGNISVQVNQLDASITALPDKNAGLAQIAVRLFPCSSFNAALTPIKLVGPR